MENKPYKFKAPKGFDASKLALTDNRPIKIHFKMIDENSVEWITKKIIDGKEVVVPFTATIHHVK
jgi:hypothetical protein